MRNIAPAEGRHRLKLWKGVLSNLLTAVAYACNLGIWPQRSTGFRWRFYLRSFLSLFISKWPTALPQERRRGCDTVHFPVFCCPGWQMGITSSPRPSNGNVINQLHPRGSISPALIQVSCSTSSVLIPFSFKISFFFFRWWGCMRCQLTFYDDLSLLSIVIAGCNQAHPTRWVSRARCLKNGPQNPMNRW